MILKGVGKMSESKTSVAPANSSGSKKQTAKMLGFGGFFAMTASMVMTVYAYPNFASSGLHLIFFLILGGVFWFLPVALVAAEMATVKGWENGGIFAWVGNTLGKRWGFSALFYQWFQITGWIRNHGILRFGCDILHRWMGCALQQSTCYVHRSCDHRLGIDANAARRNKADSSYR